MANKLAYFSGESADPSIGTEFWVTDGTDAGTRELSVASAQAAGFGPDDITQFGSRILLAGIDRQGKLNLFISNGTSAGTVELPAAGAGPNGLFLATFNGPNGPQFAPVLSEPFTVLGSDAVFPGLDSAGRVQLWSTDGTRSGTRELAVAGASSNGLDPNSFAVLGTDAIFAGRGAGDGAGLWVTDGTVAGTRELHPANAGKLDPTFTTTVGDKVFFNGVDAVGKSGLWVTDGTDQGTTELAVAGVSSAPAGLNPLYLTAFGSSLVFTGIDSSGRDSLWISDGSASGTREIVPTGALAAGLFKDYAEPDFTAFGNRLLFFGFATDGNEQLWSTDGTTAGTKQITGAAEGETTGFVPSDSGIATIGGKAVFAYHGDDTRYQLWVTDGTPTGTSELMPPGADPYGLNPTSLASLGSVVVFDGVDSSFRNELWVSDGTTAGTHKVIPAGSPNGVGSPSGFLVPVSSSTPILGGSFGPTFIEGTPGDDTIIASGGGNTIDGFGGSDRITTGTGGYTRVTEGSVGDGATGSTAITLAGRANTVSGGDANFTVTGGTGFTGVTLGDGDNTVTLGGSYNSLTIGGGNDVVDAGGGFSRVSIVGQILNLRPDDKITLAGQHNQVTIDPRSAQFAAGGTIMLSGGTGYGTYDIGAFDGSVTTDGLYNKVTSFNGSVTIAPGSGYDTVDLGRQDVFSNPGPKTVRLSGAHNTVTGEAAPGIITGGSGYGRFLLDQEYDFGSGGGGLPSHTYEVTTAGPYNTFSLLDSNTNTIVTGGDGAKVSIAEPTLLMEPGEPPLQRAPTDVTFSGIDNLLTAGNGSVTTRGGAGLGTFILGDGDDSVTTSGSSNRITLGSGNDTVSVTGDHTTITLNGTNAALTLTGAGDRVLLNVGASSTIAGGSLPDLHLVVAAGIGREILRGLADDPRTVIDLVGGAGGYATAAQVVAALRPDGNGGTLLPIGTGMLDFAGVAPTSLHAGMFVIG